MGTKETKYDIVGEFNQGISIVVKNGKYGAIMVGGKEIVPPIYDALTEFRDGLAKAKYKGEERIVNLSGQIQIKKGEELLFLPEDYDWGYDFIEDICVVIKNGKYGIVNRDFQIIEKPSYKKYSGYNNGYALFEYNNEWFHDVNCIIDTKGNVLYDNAKEIGQEFFIVSSPDEEALYGLIDKNLTIRIPCIYQQIYPLNDGLFVAEKNKINQVINTKGDVVLTLKYGESIIAKDPYFLIKTFNTAAELFDTKRLLDSGMNEVLKIKDGERLSNIFHLNQYFNIVEVVTKNNVIVRNIFNIAGKKVLTQYGGRILPDHDVLYCVSTYGGLFKIKSDGLIYLLKTNVDKKDTLKLSDLPTISLLKEIEVSSSYLNYCFFPFSTDRLLLHDYLSGCRGLTEKSGKIIVSPQYKVLVRWKNNMIIVAKESEVGNDRSLKFGIIDTNGNTLLPFEYGFIGIMRASNQLTYSLDAKLKNYHLATNAEVSMMPYGQTFLLGLIDTSLKTICSPKYNKIEVFNSSPTYYKVTIGQETGILDSTGKEIIQTKYKEIKKSNGKKGPFIASGPRSNLFPNTNLVNIINEKGEFVVCSPSGKDIFIPSDKYDWCDNFNDAGWAKVTKDGFCGKINTKGKLISISENRLLEVPECYDWACDFHYGLLSVYKEGKWGIANTNFDLVIPCNYEDIEAISTNRFKIRKGNKWGIIDNQLKTIANTEFESISHITKKYSKVCVYIHYCSVLAPRYGIIDGNGHIIIPVECEDINMVSVGTHLFWIVNIGKKGVCNEEGEVIIPLIYDNVDMSDDLFICEIYEQSNSSSSVSRNIKFSNIYTKNGEQRLCIDNTFNIDVPKEYDIACYAGFGLVRVMNKEGEWGLINLMNDVIIAPQFSYIDVFDGTFAIVGNSEDNEVILFPDEDRSYVNMKYGLIDVSGDIVLPIEYDYIDKWDNGYYYLAKKDGHRTLLSSTLHTIIETSKGLVKLDNNYIKVVGESADYGINMFGLMDFNGNVIIPTDEEHNFSEIEVLKNGFLKIIYYKGDCGNSHIGIFDNRGKIIYDNDNCDDIKLLDNGFIFVESERQILLLNLQGKCVLKKWYNKINFVSNGLLSLRDSDGWGLADIKGHIIIDTHYLDELVFEDNVSDICVQGSSLTQKINEKGIVIVHNGKDEIELPESVYWGTDYVNGLSIVRRKVNACHVIGVVDIKGNMIIPAQYKSVTLLSDNTIRVMDGDCYGLFDLEGRTILPPIFTDIYYIAEDRIIVEWNLNIVKEWDKMGYTPGNSYTKYKGSDGDLDYRACNRSALCNSKGEIINDKELLYVGNFIGNYAKAYKKIEKGKIKLNTKIEVIEADAIKYRQVGVIDLSGNTIVQPIYDRIDLYKKSAYAKVCKDGKYGIIHLPSKSIKMYDDVPIKHLWDVDALGRCVYSEDCEYNDDRYDWVGGTRGVLNPQGVLVPPGKYTDICLIDNGLIEVSNDDGNLYGLLDKEGKEILPIKYTYIFSFKGNYATICIGGEKDYYSYRMIKGGKWGVIDNTGKIIKECVCDEEEVLEGKVCDNNKTDNEKTFIRPSVILSDSIPEPRERNSNDYYDSYRDDYDEGPHSKYGGYNGWDDETIDEAFDGNPELTWNID